MRWTIYCHQPKGLMKYIQQIIDLIILHLKEVERVSRLNTLQLYWAVQSASYQEAMKQLYNAYHQLKRDVEFRVYLQLVDATAWPRLQAALGYE